MLPEDDDLLRLDQELDERMRNLCREKFSVSVADTKGYGNKSTMSSPSSRRFNSNGSAMNTEMKLKADSVPRSRTKTRTSAYNDDGKSSKNKFIYGVEGNDTESHRKTPVTFAQHEAGEDEHDKHDETSRNLSDEDSEKLEEAKDAVFDEFLDQSTQIRIKTLRNKVAASTEALTVMQSECKRLAQAKQEATSASHAAESSRRKMSKQLQTLKQESARHQKSNKHLQERVKELTCECQMLRKELSSSRQSECERKNAQSSLHSQVTRSRADNAALKEQITELKQRHKNELDELRSAFASSSTRVKELERQQRNYSALAKKQEILIRVLDEQKTNIEVAKAAASLEEKFLSVVTPLQPP